MIDRQRCKQPSVHMSIIHLRNGNDLLDAMIPSSFVDAQMIRMKMNFADASRHVSQINIEPYPNRNLEKIILTE
jgi:hypothetical protein